MKDQKEVVDITKSTLPTLSSRAMFWRPKYLCDSYYLEHIPFYFWLVEAQQSNLIFEPDLTSGSSYFAMCQAIDKLNLDSRCIANFLLSDSGDQRIENYNHENYREFSSLLTETVRDVLYDIEDKSIDLLILRHDSQLILNKDLMDRWMEKLSDQAIVLIQGSKQKEIKPLCRKLKQSYKTFEFDHGGGLLLVCYGSNQSHKILSLVNHNINDSSTRVIQSIYGRLGSGCRDSLFNAIGRNQISDLNSLLEAKNDELIAQKNVLDKAISDTNKLKNTISTLEKNSSSYKEEIKLAEKAFQDAESLKKILILQVNQLQEELDVIVEKNQETNQELSQSKSREKELSKIASKYETVELKNLSLTTDIDTLKNELKNSLEENKKLKLKIDALELDNKNLNDKVSRKIVEIELEKAKSDSIGVKSSVNAENEIAMLQIKQLQEELEHYFNKYQQLLRASGSGSNELSESRLERSFQLSKLVNH